MYKNKKIISVLLIVIVSLSILSGCQMTEQDTEIEHIVITDQLGREVTIPANVERIISSYYITSSLLIALDAKDKVVGIEIKADKRELYKKAAPEFLELPAVGSGKTINIEECLKLEPDLVIIPYRLKDFIEKFDALNIPVIAVAPESMESFLDCTEIIGKAIGKEDRALELINYYNDKINLAVSATKNIIEKPNVYISGSDSPLTTCTSKMYQNDLIEMAGGQNASASLMDGYWTTISIEELLNWNPDYMYRVQYASYDINDIVNNKKYENINAIKNNKVFTFPSKIEPWDYPTPSSVLGILWLMNSLHPELYSIEDYIADAKDFYQRFFNIEVTSEDMGL